MNNLEAVTTTSSKYGDSFGFTEREVFQALDAHGLSDRKREVKDWYVQLILLSPLPIVCGIDFHLLHLQIPAGYQKAPHRLFFLIQLFIDDLFIHLCNDGLSPKQLFKGSFQPLVTFPDQSFRSRTGAILPWLCAGADGGDGRQVYFDVQPGKRVWAV